MKSKVRSNASSPSKIVFVRIYADWCGYCQKMHKEWETLSNSTSIANLGVKVTQLEESADKKEISALLSKIKFPDPIRYPTILLIWNEKSYKKFQGERNLGEMKKFLGKNVKMLKKNCITRKKRRNF